MHRTHFIKIHFIIKYYFYNVKDEGDLIAGPLADRIMEPAMLSGGSLAPWFGWLVGNQPGSGMGVMFLGTAVCGTTISITRYLFRPIRNVESDLPDHDKLEVIG